MPRGFCVAGLNAGLKQDKELINMIQYALKQSWIEPAFLPDGRPGWQIVGIAESDPMTDYRVYDQEDSYIEPSRYVVRVSPFVWGPYATRERAEKQLDNFRHRALHALDFSTYREVTI